MTAITLVLTFSLVVNRSQLPSIIDEVLCVCEAGVSAAPQAGIKEGGIIVNVPAITVRLEPRLIAWK
jgi:hypothetical protein